VECQATVAAEVSRSVVACAGGCGAAGMEQRLARTMSFKR
jgi:hypothetical protein